MDKKLIPAHVLFAKWFIRIRWIALLLLILTTLAVSNLLDIAIRERPVYILCLVLLILNVIHKITLRGIIKRGGDKTISRIKKEIHLQIITDLLVLSLILHFSGGIENPFILFFFFHLIIASSIFSTLGSYLYAFYCIVLFACLSVLECYAVIPHYHLTGFINHDQYSNPLFIFGTGSVFAFTSIFIVSLSHMIIYRSVKSEETYVKTNIELENKDKLKNEYVLRVTHDIKGHVAAIQSCIEVIRSGASGQLNIKQEEFVNRACERTELLTTFIKNLLNLTKKRLKQENEFEEINFRELITKTVIPVQTLARDKSIDFTFTIDKSINLINGDPFTLEELYSNLLLNAIKYTPANGHISLLIRNRFNHIISEISDSGIGIPLEEQTKIFDEFYRASNVPKDIKSGSGLGLSIVKQIVESHKGKIWVNSEPGVWTRFTFILPKNPSEIL